MLCYNLCVDIDTVNCHRYGSRECAGEFHTNNFHIQCDDERAFFNSHRWKKSTMKKWLCDMRHRRRYAVAFSDIFLSRIGRNQDPKQQRL